MRKISIVSIAFALIFGFTSVYYKNQNMECFKEVERITKEVEENNLILSELRLELKEISFSNNKIRMLIWQNGYIKGCEAFFEYGKFSWVKFKQDSTIASNKFKKY